MIDMHTHHARCGHAVGDLEAYIESAIEKGLTHIGLSDHLPLVHVNPADYWPEMAMPLEELPRYVEEAFQLQAKYRQQINVLVGLEADYIAGYEAPIAAILDEYPWDYLIGSVHFLGTWDISDYRQTTEWEKRDVDEVYVSYYHAMQEMIRTGYYDIVGHIDVVKRFGHRPRDAERIRELEDQTLALIVKQDMVIELNCSGWDKPVAEPFPSAAILERASKLPLRWTLGSDAHRPEAVGLHLEKGKSLLQAIGCKALHVYQKRQRVQIPLA